jgi:predicted Fe-Mo cluster-binding NifX family protein
MKEELAGDTEVRLAIPVDTKKGLSSTVSEHFGTCPYFLICDLKDGRVKETRIVSNPGAKVDVRMGLEASKFLIDQGVDAILVIAMGDGPYWMLKSNSIAMYKILQAPDTEEEFERCLENYGGLPKISK